MHNESENRATSLAANLLTEFIGIIATVFIIDLAFQNAEAKKAEKYRRIAFERLSTPLARHIDTWVQIFKSVIPEKPMLLPREIDELRRPEFMRYLNDFDVITAAPSMNERWTGFMKRRLEEANKSFDVVLDKYAQFLEPEEIQAIEKCANSTFMHMIPQMLHLIDKGVFGGVAIFTVKSEKAPDDENAIASEHLQALSELIRVARASLEKPNSFQLSASSWSESVSPAFGSSRRHQRPQGSVPYVGSTPPSPT